MEPTSSHQPSAVAGKKEKGRRGDSELFYHRVVDNFLPAELFSQVVKTYQGTAFYHKQSDLFDFYQSNELRDAEEYRDFLRAVREEMHTDLRAIEAQTSEEELDLFASCYLPGNYLLPHDDCLEGRVLAFSFYLNSGEGGSAAGGRLVLYGEDGATPRKEITPVANRLVIFEVSSRSFHEVEKSRFTREALTGWLRSSGQRPQSAEMPYEPNRYWIFSKEEMASLVLPERLVAIPLYPELEWARAILDGLEWVPRLNRVYCRALEPAAQVGELGWTEIPLNLIPVDGVPVDTLVVKLEPGGYVLLNDRFNCESSFLVVVSLFGGTICLVDSAGMPREEITAEGVYGTGANVSLYVPPSDHTGYIVAYRMNSE